HLPYTTLFRSFKSCPRNQTEQAGKFAGLFAFEHWLGLRQIYGLSELRLAASVFQPLEAHFSALLGSDIELQVRIRCQGAEERRSDNGAVVKGGLEAFDDTWGRLLATSIGLQACNHGVGDHRYHLGRFARL